METTTRGRAIAGAGYNVVVNLALSNSDNAIADEGSIVTGNGLNARVSAFVYHYLGYEKGWEDEAAKTKLLLKWEPQMDRTWREFLAIPKEQVTG